MLSPILTSRLKKEIPGTEGFWLSETETAFKDAATFLKDELKADDDDIIMMLKSLYDAVSHEFGE